MVIYVVYSEGERRVLYSGNDREEAKKVIKASEGTVDKRIYFPYADEKGIGLFTSQYFDGRLWRFANTELDKIDLELITKMFASEKKFENRSFKNFD